MTKEKEKSSKETSKELSTLRKHRFPTGRKKPTKVDTITHTKGGKPKSVKSLKRMIRSKLKDDADFWSKVYELRRQGVRLTQISKTLQVPYMTLYSWLQEPERQAKYLEAEAQIADELIDENIVVAQELLKPNSDGVLSPHNARVATDINFKVASAFKPSKYGEKKQIEIKQDVRTQHVLQLRELHEKSKLKDVTPERFKIEEKGDEDS